MGLPVPSFWLRSTLGYRFSNKEIYQKCPEDLRGKYQHPELIIYQFQGLMLTTFMCSLLNSPFLPQKKNNFTKRKTLTESKIVFGNAAICSLQLHSRCLQFNLCIPWKQSVALPWKSSQPQGLQGRGLTYHSLTQILCAHKHRFTIN